MPRIRAIPKPSSPIMNNQSTNGFPARLSKKGLSGPYAPNLRKPNVGETPSSQALPDSVAKPSPKSLSKKGQRKVQPSPILSVAKTAYFIVIIPDFLL